MSAKSGHVVMPTLSLRETLNKSIRDLPQVVIGTRVFPVTRKINRLARLITAVRPCTTGLSGLILSVRSVPVGDARILFN